MRMQVDTAKGKFAIEFDAQADFVGCLLTGVLAALPCFLEEFMKCLALGPGPGTGFKPGDRDRCD